MLPKIVIRQSKVYNVQLKEPENYNPLSFQQIENEINKLELLWSKYRTQILNEISKVTGLKWRESQINIYVTDKKSWFSIPLTISVVGMRNQILPSRRLLQVIIHELIHRIWAEQSNWKIISKKREKFLKKYEKEPEMVKAHILLMAILKHIYLELFSKEDLELDIRVSSFDYKRSWEIVQGSDYKELIRVINPKYKA
jgi:Zn-dependent peptidase ImmA (M78 family)